MRRRTHIPQGPPRCHRCRIVCEDDQRTFRHTDGPLELIQLEEVLEPVTHPQQDYQREEPSLQAGED